MGDDDDLPQILASRTGLSVKLVEDGDLVSPGQPLIRLHPEAVAQ